MDQLSLVEPIDGLGQGIIVAPIPQRAWQPLGNSKLKGGGASAVSEPKSMLEITSPGWYFTKAECAKSAKCADTLVPYAELVGPVTGTGHDWGPADSRHGIRRQNAAPKKKTYVRVGS